MFKTLKQELLFIPIMAILIEFARRAIIHFYPETALFDRGSELESFLLSVWQITWVTSACWLLMRVVMPDAYNGLKRFYLNFKYRPDKEQESFSLKLFLVFFFGLVLLLAGKSNNHETILRKNLVDSLTSQLHVREVTGKNDGVEVEKYLRFVGRYKGDAWCAAYVSYNLHSVGVTTAPRTAWAPVYANSKYVIWSPSLLKQRKAQTPKPGDCFTVYHETAKRVGHVGFIVGQNDHYFITNEGNTGLSGTREGSGVHSLKRSKHKIYAITNYITPHLKTNEKAFNYTLRNTGSLSKQLSQKTDTITGKDFRSKGICYHSKGLDILPGYNLQSEGRQLTDTSNGNNGQKRRGKPTEYCDRFATLESFSINCKRKAGRKVPLQGSGNPSEASGAPDKRTAKANRIKAAGKANNSNSGSPLYAARC